MTYCSADGSRWRFVNAGEPPIERCSPEVLKMVKEDTRLLPVVQWDSREFLVDVERRQFRNVNDAGDSIGMHSPKGRAIVRQMEGTQWTVHAVDTGSQEDAVV